MSNVEKVRNGLPDVQYTKLDTLGITELFKCIVLSEELGIAKPDARIFLWALEQTGLAPEESLYVGDSFDHDVVGAINAGMSVCWFNPKKIKPSSADIKPTFEIEALNGFKNLIQ